MIDERIDEILEGISDLKSRLESIFPDKGVEILQLMPRPDEFFNVYKLKLDAPQTSEDGTATSRGLELSRENKAKYAIGETECNLAQLDKDMERDKYGFGNVFREEIDKKMEEEHERGIAPDGTPYYKVSKGHKTYILYVDSDDESVSISLRCCSKNKTSELSLFPKRHRHYWNRKKGTDNAYIPLRSRDIELAYQAFKDFNYWLSEVLDSIGEDGDSIGEDNL